MATFVILKKNSPIDGNSPNPVTLLPCHGFKKEKQAALNCSHKKTFEMDGKKSRIKKFEIF
jgi:hypothetical protein